MSDGIKRLVIPEGDVAVADVLLQIAEWHQSVVGELSNPDGATFVLEDMLADMVNAIFLLAAVARGHSH